MGTRIRLTRMLTLEAPQQVDDGAGGFLTNWVELGVLWAECTARGGRETLRGGTGLSRTPYRVIVRAAPLGSPSRPSPEQRFRDGQRIFHIRSVADFCEDGRYLICQTEEEVAV